jgi:hypothetical protein
MYWLWDLPALLSLGGYQSPDGKAWVDPDLCADCWVCLRKKVCPKEALQAKELTDFYQVFRHVLCDPVETFADTGVTGRGTEECKTNDVTGRYRRGEVGLAVDMGRPGLGCTLRDVEKVAMALAAAGQSWQARRRPLWHSS